MYDSKAIIEYIRTAEKRTPAKAYIQLKTCSAENFGNETKSASCEFETEYRRAKEYFSETCKVFGCGSMLIVFGELENIRRGIESCGGLPKAQSAEAPHSESGTQGKEEVQSTSPPAENTKPMQNESLIEYAEIEITARNSAIPLLDIENLDARIEPGAIIRDNVKIGKHAVIMMGAVINIGSEIGARTMIDMGAVLGGRAIVGSDCHIGAGAVLAGVIEPESALPVIIEDGVFVGANAVVIEGCRIGEKSVIGAGAVVTRDIPPHSLAAGTPARIVKTLKDSENAASEIIKELREL